MQLAFVPAAIDRALDWWTGHMGAGPFFHLPHVHLEDMRFRGTPTAPDFSLWLGYWGDMQVELIQQHDDSPSIYRADFPGVGDGQRLHHVCLLVDDVAAAVTMVGACEVMQEGIVPGGGSVAYVQPPLGPMLELLKPAPGTAELFAMMREAHRGWDGRNPVRSIG
jgi:catechol 2,3-dioxygenase-like lactoylglutathione lyase family enzyme